MNRPIRVAQVIGKAAAGGVEAMIFNLYKEIDKTKVQFDFFVENTSILIDKEKIESMGGKVVIIPPYTKPFKYMKTLTKLFKQGNYDIVHSNMNALSVFTLKAAKKAGIKIRIAHSHSTSNKKEWKKNIIKNILRPFSKKYATHYFACSELAGRWLFGNKTFDKGEVTVINNAIDMNKFVFNEEKRQEIRKKYNIDDKFVIGHVGRFVKQKNHKFLLDVFAEVLKQIPNAVLFLVGEGELFEQIKNYAQKLEIDDKVIFAGAQANTADFYNAFDVFAFPSLYEGLGIVLVEAQTNGLNCIASNFVPDEVSFTNKIKFLPLNKTLWLEKIVESGKNSSNRKQIENLRDCKFNIKKEIRRLEKKYEDLVKNNKKQQ